MNIFHIPPAEELSIPINRPSTVGVVSFVANPVHAMSPHDMMFVINVFV